jgi:hypothetical protein
MKAIFFLLALGSFQLASASEKSVTVHTHFFLDEVGKTQTKVTTDLVLKDSWTVISESQGLYVLGKAKKQSKEDIKLEYLVFDTRSASAKILSNPTLIVHKGDKPAVIKSQSEHKTLIIEASANAAS